MTISSGYGLILLIVAGILCVFSSPVDELDAILLQGLSDKVYPAVVAFSMTADGNFKYSRAFGNFNYSDSSPDASFDTIFDLASLSKVLATTTAMSLLYQQGHLSLDDKVSKYLGENFNSQGKQDITLRNCLLHNAGFPPDPVPWYWDLTFGCPNSTPDESITPAEDFSCLEKIYNHLLFNQTLQNVPGEVYVYSDLSFITLQMVVGSIVWNNNLVQSKDLRSECASISMKPYSLSSIPESGILLTCYFEAFVRRQVFEFEASLYARHNHAISPSSSSSSSPKNSLLMPNTGYDIPSQKFSSCAPTTNDTGTGSYTHTRIQGRVSDGNCYAMGGVCGHAGVFSTVPDVARFLHAILLALNPEENGNDVFMLNATTIKTFTTIYNVTQSSRGLGWTTNSLKVKDYGFDHGCGTLSEATFMHTGYTGGCVCVDPENKVFSVILTNRVYNCQGQVCPAGASDAVKAVYRSYHTKVAELIQN